eukprot:CAMPEP_0197522634 /NCGR_PEP_ID=MMETSP1318-20131121/7735_1 /TAXON_ID=552666 /ORGANISM="Partenskyella glossopodia, Strain RCC365" /LENGTH=1665 /DNA_ID=CAMNT_0043075065 /DNA_START=308 /DNA_END=5304 /DNA_ORIENTATION=+
MSSEEEIDQVGVYDTCVKKLADKFMQGFNATILAYGQTGSGKTYTMGTASSHNIAYDSLGIVPRVVEQIFSEIGSKQDTSNIVYQVKVQFLEIYNDAINDLLNTRMKSTDLQIRETKQGGIYVLGATEALVKTPEAMLDCLDRGTACRVTGSTNMNATSSRSHAIFSMILSQTKQIEMDDKAETREEVITSKFHFVDLAGSERLKRTGAVGARMMEGININKGLLALGNVISALGDEKRKGSHVPFRDSKITRLLQDSLGGNSETLMIACVSPSDTNFDETLNTLKYANRARNIKNKPIINRDPMAAKIEAMGKRIKELEAALGSGGVDMLTPSVSSEAYEEVTEQLLNSECEVKRLNKRLEAQRHQLSAMRDKVLDSETERDKLKFKIQKVKTKLKKVKKTALSVKEEGAKGAASSEDATPVDMQISSDEESSEGDSEEVGVIAQLRRQVLDLEAKLESEQQTQVLRPRASGVFLGGDSGESKRRISLHSTAHMDDHDDEDNDYTEQDAEVEVETPYGTGSLIESRADGILVIELLFGVCYLRDIVSTPFGTGPVLKRLPEPAGGGGAVVVVKLGDSEQSVPAEVCASHWVPEEEDDDENNQNNTTNINNNSANKSPGKAGESGSNDAEMRLKTLGALTSEVRTLDEDIQKKELLMKRLIQTQQRARVIEKDFKSKINILEEEVQKIRWERDRALKEMNRQEGANDSTRKQLVSKYENKLKKVTDDLASLRRKYQENQKLLRSRAKAIESMKRLKNEIAVHKKQRVSLQKKMREASESHRSWVANTRKELKKAMKERNRAKLKITKLQSKINKQNLIIKRREDEKEVLKRRLKLYQTKARSGRKVRGRKGGKKKKNIVDEMCSALEYELGEAVAKTDITQRLNEKIIKQRETKKQIEANKRRLIHLDVGTPEYHEALETDDTLLARLRLIENQIVQLRTDLALWKKKEHPGNLNQHLFKRHPTLGQVDLQKVLLKLLSKIVRQEMRAKAQDRVLDQYEAKIMEHATSQRRASAVAASATSRLAQHAEAAVKSSFSLGFYASPGSKQQLQQQQQQQKQKQKQQQQQQQQQQYESEGYSSPRSTGIRKPIRNNWTSPQHGPSHGSSSLKDGNTAGASASASASTHAAGGGGKKYASVFERLTDQASFTGVYKTRAKDRAAKRKDKDKSRQLHTKREGNRSHHPHQGSSTSMMHANAPSSASRHASKEENVFDRLTDSSKFTGMYKTRFTPREEAKAVGRSGHTPPSRFKSSEMRVVDGAESTSSPTTVNVTNANAANSSSTASQHNHKGNTSSSKSEGPSFGLLSTQFNALADEFNSNAVFHSSKKPTADKEAATHTHTHTHTHTTAANATPNQTNTNTNTATATNSNSVFSRLTDKSSYTGTFRNKVVTTKPTPTPTPNRSKTPNPTTTTTSSSSSNLKNNPNTNSHDGNKSTGTAAHTDKSKSSESLHNTPTRTLSQEPNANATPLNPITNITTTQAPANNNSNSNSNANKQQSVFDRLTNTSGYTGMYKLRRNKAAADRVEAKRIGTRSSSRLAAKSSGVILGTKSAVTPTTSAHAYTPSLPAKNGVSSAKPKDRGTEHASALAQPQSQKERVLRTSMLEEELDGLMASAKMLDASATKPNTKSLAPSMEAQSRGGSLNVFERLTATTRLRRDKSRSTSPSRQ